MTSRRYPLIGLLLAVALSGCRAAPKPHAPGDPLLDAIRAEERAGNLTYVESQGKALFAQYCATCHGDEGKGDGQNASNLTPPPPDLTTSGNVHDKGYLEKVITQGSAAVGRSPLSPPWGRSLSAQQVDYLVAYCQALGRSKS
jgi:mono/diheme cytochrome c family protein